VTASLTLVLGDIVEQEVDVVVNAANSGLMGGGGVDGAILRAGGEPQRAARAALRAKIGPLPPGRAAASAAGTMRCRWLVHVVGPIFSPDEDRSELLVSCYREALRVADELGARSVAFPAVSAGSYGWPIDSAAHIAVSTVLACDTAVQDIRFVLYGQAAYDAFERALGDADGDAADGDGADGDGAGPG
jgi:O-acetyl-ADP-ribose deacetylase (regulator of RNase III)